MDKKEVEKIVDSKIKSSNKEFMDKDEVRDLIKKTMLSYHKFMWEKKGIWINQI